MTFGTNPAEAAHVGKRGLSQKCPDREAIPVCAEHHRIWATSLHVLGKRFWAFWFIDRDELIAELRDRYKEHGR
jgi:hypothetical protein